jgi:glutaredoxin
MMLHPLPSIAFPQAEPRLLSARRTLRCWLGALCLLGMASGCRLDRDAPLEEAKNPVDTSPVAHELPPLLLNDDTKDLLLTWVNDKGDFLVVHKPADVPQEGREKVRVVVTTKEEGTENLVYVADLRSKAPDGHYKVSTMTRAQWNELGADRRKARIEALLPPKPSDPPPADSGASTTGGAKEAIIYGADWCKPCHDAESYLKSLGVKVTKKNIEKSSAARAEMQQKLHKAGKAGASIPIIDVMGQLFVGFNKAVLKAAVERGAKPKTL